MQLKLQYSSNYIKSNKHLRLTLETDKYNLDLCTSLSRPVGRRIPIIIVEKEIDAVGSKRVEDGPDLSAVLEPFLFHLFSCIGMDGFLSQAINLEPHCENLTYSCSSLGIAGPAALHPFFKGLLHGRCSHDHAPALSVHNVRCDIFE